jgi:hypothetical protein
MYNSHVRSLTVLLLSAALLSVQAKSASVSLESRGPVLLGYSDSVLPSGVCKLMSCKFRTAGSKGGLKTYFYDGKFGNLTVYRDSSKTIVAASYLTVKPLSIGAQAELTKFSRGFGGVIWSQSNTINCLSGVVQNSKTQNGILLKFTCYSNNRDITIFVDSQSKARNWQTTEFYPKFSTNTNVISGIADHIEARSICLRSIASQLGVERVNPTSGASYSPSRFDMGQLHGWMWKPMIRISNTEYTAEYHCNLFDNGNKDIDFGW